MRKKKFKLLIVDDEPDICTTVQSFFSKRGFVVSSTGSGIEALSMMKSSKPDIVLLDIMLDDLGGKEVLKRIREHDKETKVVIITGQLYPEEEIQRISALGISGYKNKPLILEEVAKMVYEVLGQKPPLNITKIDKKAKNKAVGDGSNRVVVHKVLNLLGIVRNKCENFTLNIEDGIYKDKTPAELVNMSVEIMNDIQKNVDQAVEVVRQIKGDEKT